jgi:hypothetical protein
VSLRGRIKLTAPGKFSGQACVAALKGYWRELSSRAFPTPVSRHGHSAPAYHSSDPATCSPELRDLIATLEVIRRKMFANSLLRSGVKWFVWLLFGLIGAALVIANFGGAVISIVALAVIGVIAIFAWTWRTRPSNYEAARRLDSAAGLKDRLSTATFFGAIDDSGGMVAEQRKDALARLATLDARRFFPVEVPGNLRRAGALALIVTGLFAYRVHHRAPLIVFLQNSARSPLVQSLLTPIAHAMEKDLQRTLALVTHKQDAAADQAQRADAVNTDDLWKSDQGAGSEDQKDPSAANAAEPPQDQMDPDGNQEGDPNGEARQSDSYSQSQQGKNGEENQNGKAQAQQNEQQGPEGRQSLGQSLMQALKNMLSNSPSQQSNNRAQQPNAQGTPQAGNSQQPGQNESDKRGDSRGNSDAKQKASQTASEGAGSQIGTKELRKDQAANPVNAVPDRVALEAGNYKEQTRMKVATETGAAQLADRGLSPRQDAVTNGAEQENIPSRYRFYVQRYFEHADSDKH